MLYPHSYNLRYPSPSQILGFVDQYVFYADVDVMFLRDISLATFAPLPAFYAVAVEANKLVAVRGFTSDGSNSSLALTLCDPGSIDGSSTPSTGKRSTNGLRAEISQIRALPCMGEVDYGNAGVMLLHVERMRRTHAEFIRFIFSEQVVAAGMDHGVYGPVDQGAYNRFFAGRFDVHLEASWNWKPYWGHAANVSLVHFHGPKPHDYFVHKKNNQNNNTGRDNLGFRGIFDTCDEVDSGNVTPGCMAYSHRYAEELTKVMQVRHARFTSISFKEGRSYRTAHSPTVSQWLAAAAAVALLLVVALGITRSV